MAGQLVYHPGVLIPDAVVVRRLEAVHTRVATTCGRVEPDVPGKARRLKGPRAERLDLGVRPL